MPELVGNKRVEDAAIADVLGAVERHYYEVPWPVAHYDATPTDP